MTDFSQVTAAPGPDLLTPDNCAVLFVDHQPQMFFGTGSGDRTAIINAATGLAKAAKVFDVPVVLSTVAAESFSGSRSCRSSRRSSPTSRSSTAPR